MIRTVFNRRLGPALSLALVAAACTPVFLAGSSIKHQAVGAADVRIVWNTAFDAEMPDADHLINSYEIRVDGALVATHNRTVASCRLGGLASATAYSVEITAQSTSDENSATLPGPFGTLSTTVTTPAGAEPGGAIGCTTETDTDGDRLPDWAETKTGVFIDMTDTGTDPNVADTDGDGLADGDETVGTIDGLQLALMGASPLRHTIFLEIDWVDDTADCGAHTHRPAAAAVDRYIQSFADSPVANPDGTTGIDMIVDYGQGGSFFNQGTLVPDVTNPIGSINGGVSGGEFKAIKKDEFHPSREGYFHYAVHLHRYNTSSGSSGQAEVNGDDLIVSLQCSTSVNNVSNTLMHEIGHNLGLRHGGDEVTNYKPNYNSVMNYRFQFPGIDRATGAGACDAVGDQVLSFSAGSRVNLDESAVDESAGVCGATAIDFNANLAIDPSPYAQSLNFDATIETLTDTADWAILNFAGVGDSDGAALVAPELIDEQPVPIDFAE